MTATYQTPARIRVIETIQQLGPVNTSGLRKVFPEKDSSGVSQLVRIMHREGLLQELPGAPRTYTATAEGLALAPVPTIAKND